MNSKRQVKRKLGHVVQIRVCRLLCERDALYQQEDNYDKLNSQLKKVSSVISQSFGSIQCFPFYFQFFHFTDFTNKQDILGMIPRKVVSEAIKSVTTQLFCKLSAYSMLLA